MQYEIDDKYFIARKKVDGNKIAEYFTSNEQRHREDGPAFISVCNWPSNEYLEWWKNGKLIATYNRAKDLMLKTEDGKKTGLYKIQVPKKWKGLERALTFQDIESFQQNIANTSGLSNVSGIMHSSDNNISIKSQRPFMENTT